MEGAVESPEWGQNGLKKRRERVEFGLVGIQKGNKLEHNLIFCTLRLLLSSHRYAEMLKFLRTLTSRTRRAFPQPLLFVHIFLSVYVICAILKSYTVYYWSEWRRIYLLLSTSPDYSCSFFRFKFPQHNTIVMKTIMLKFRSPEQMYSRGHLHIAI